MNKLLIVLRLRFESFCVQLFCAIFHFFWAAGMVGPAAGVVRLAIMRQQRCMNGEGGCIKLLLLPKAGFNEDMHFSFVGQPDFEIFTLDRRILKYIFEQFLPLEIDDNNYINVGEEYEVAKYRLRHCWCQLIPRSIKAKGIQVVLTGNFSYAAEQEFAGACCEENIGFVALHKETLNTPKLSEFYEEIFRTRKNKFQGSLVLAYNAIGRDSMINAGVATADQVVVTGMPRLDSLHRRVSAGSSTTPSKRPMVLYFSTDEKTGLPELGRKVEGISRERLKEEWDQLNLEGVTGDAHLAVLELARENSWLDVLVKTKGNPAAFSYIDRVYGNGNDWPGNFYIIHGGDPQKLLERCTVVGGMYTTSLFEAITLKIPVVMPRFGEAVDEKIAPYYLDIGNCALYAGSKKEFKEMLQTICTGKQGAEPDKDDVDALLDWWLGNNDGMSGKRVRDAIRSLVETLGKRQLSKDV